MSEMTLFGIPVIPVLVFVILVALAIAFFRYFFIPANRLDANLKLIIANVEATRARGQNDLSRCFEPDRAIAAIFNEYRETLHVQKDLDVQTGEMVERAIRSTVPAEMFLSPHAVVDNRVHAEFFKHLPGIFTGIGIIGTFTGLLTGLSSFQISDDSGVVRNSLTALLHGVSEAFIVSAFAIIFAMITTGLEKFRLNSLYRKVTQLAHEIDATYEAGAGEEYLARLVSSSEDAASQTKILKDALVADLREILTELADRQINATVQRSNELGTTIAGALTDALKGPLDQIAGAVGQVSQDQSSAVTKLLTDVLASFSVGIR
ncbi:MULTISPECIES: MotA/TolQ/ExbB proton channel family protein [Sphingobium]|uniref:MotA/TolQ/ExbB proton channel family protein n=1 Tax=Sphingobium TaxID=165695 RepID=UPI000E7682C8|nr:MotA/TolQ/ExbB proton channel family protein [Sphingobium sp. YG1]